MASGEARWLKIHLLLGVIPLAVGVSVFLLWLVTGWTWLMVVAPYVLLAGLISVLAAFASLVVAITKTIRAGAWSRRLLARTVLVGTVAVVNFPVAGAIIWTVIALETAYTVEVRNNASAPVEQAALTGGGVSLKIGEVKPGASVTRRFYIAHDGTLLFSAQQSQKQLNVVVDGYVTNNLGGRKEVRVSADGTVAVRDRRK
jgi:hypothetical protein